MSEKSLILIQEQADGSFAEKVLTPVAGELAGFDASQNPQSTGAIHQGSQNTGNTGVDCSISGYNNAVNSGDNCSISGHYNYNNSGSFCIISGANATYNALSYARVHGGSANARIIDLVSQITTTDANPTELLLGGSGGTRIIIPANSAWMFDIQAVAKTTGAAVKMFHRTGVIVRDGSNNTTCGTVNTIGTDQEAGTTNATLAVAADDTNEALTITVTCSSGTVRCSARVQLTQVDYAA